MVREGSVTLRRTPPPPPGAVASGAAGPVAAAAAPPSGPRPVLPLDEALVVKLSALVQANPEEISNYHALARVYEDAGDFGSAEGYMLQARARRPDAPNVYLELAAFDSRRGDFAKAIEALTQRSELDPNDAEPFYTLATYHWEKAHRDSSLTEAEKRAIISKGLAHIDRALALRSDYADAMILKGLLLRSQAMLETDDARKQELIAEATRLRDEAVRLKKR